MKQKNCGIFTISLDFELYWGMKDVVSVQEYKANLEGTPKAVESMLDLFKRYDIHTTWAVMGYLFYKDIKELQANYPTPLPQYKDDDINLYKYIEQNIDLKNEYHFAPESIRLISSYPNQEIATHTFSHYYCLEEGQNEETFYADLIAAKTKAKEFDLELDSLVFPRNQYNESYLDVIKKAKIRSYRGNEKGWMYDAVSEEEKKTLTKRALRILDSFVNLSGYHTYKLQDISKNRPFNIPASRFLRPHSPKLSFLDSFRLKRIKDAMSYAAKNGELFHLWWHPHNFGTFRDENIYFLEKILLHFKSLEKEFGFESLCMNEVSEKLIHYHH